MFDPTIPYTLFTKWRKIQTEQNVLKCGKKLIFLKCKKNVSVSVHAREQVAKMNKMLFFILFSQSAVLRPSRLLLLSIIIVLSGSFVSSIERMFIICNFDLF